MEFGIRIKEARKRKKWSVYELADAIYVKSPGYISRIEGRGEIPGPEMIVKLAEALEIDIDELFRIAAAEKSCEASRIIKDRYENALALYRKTKKVRE